MATLTAERIMLYCPKCQRKYEQGSQRFCNNDGGRLLPAVNAGVKRQNESKGVFTNLLAKTSTREAKDEKLSKNPRFVKKENKVQNFEPPNKSKIFKTQEKQNTINKTVRPVSKLSKLENTSSKQKSVEKVVPKQNKGHRSEFANKAEKQTPVITTNDVNLGRAELGDRQKNPTGRLALTWNNPNVLIGQTIKGRYYIVEKIDQDLTSIAYIAEDKIKEGKKVVLRVLMEQTSDDDFQNKLLSEERISLSHINHPNIAKVLDSGELPEGKPFIAIEFEENVSVDDYLTKTGIFNPMRSARIIRQASFALSEVHQNGILHRNLQSKHLLLTVSEAGNEIVKVTDFCVSDGKITKDNFKNKAPEQINGQLPTFASDSYSLAVIAYKMLTNRFPFKGETEKELLKSQKSGLNVPASDLNTEISPLVDNILTKALSYNPSDRYPKARDFGEAFFNALTTATPWKVEKQENTKPEVELDLTEKKQQIKLPHIPLGISNELKVKDASDISIVPEFENDDIHIESSESDLEIQEIENADLEAREDVKETDGNSPKKDMLWRKRSPEPTNEGGGIFTFLSILGLLALVIGAIAGWNYFFGLEEQQPEIAEKSSEVSSEVKPAQGVDSNLNKNLIPEEEIESPPPPRIIKTPEGFEYFENAKQNLNPELAKNFRGFSIAYPKDWKLKKFDKNRDKVDDKFLDIANETDDGVLVEQLLISPYKSKGTFSEDTDLFPKLVEKSNKDISKSLNGNFEVVSEGETTIQNGRWKAYQVNFKTKEAGLIKGKEVEIWGRRLWIPVQRPGVEHGFIITMVATSLTEGVDSADDVGKKGDLAKILETFEPNQNY